MTGQIFVGMKMRKAEDGCPVCERTLVIEKDQYGIHLKANCPFCGWSIVWGISGSPSRSCEEKEAQAIENMERKLKQISGGQ